MKINAIYLLTILLFIWSGCKKDDDVPPDTSINFFSINDDIQLGKQLDQEILSNPDEYPILDEQQYPEAYAHLRRIRDSILNTGRVRFEDRFEWSVKIIHDDDVLNAFAAPGGYIYVYTGIIKFLDTEHEFAGVLGHEIAHADRRHSTDQLTTSSLKGVVVDLLLGDSSVLGQVVAGLWNLKFSRKNEAEADEFSVIYLCPTAYQADGASAFFEKIVNAGGGGGATFLSTHPEPSDRVNDIKAKKEELMCDGNSTFDSRYEDFKNSLP